MAGDEVFNDDAFALKSIQMSVIADDYELAYHLDGFRCPSSAESEVLGKRILEAVDSTARSACVVILRLDSALDLVVTRIVLDNLFREKLSTVTTVFNGMQYEFLNGSALRIDLDLKSGNSLAGN